MDKKKIVIFGGGTTFPVRQHFSLCAKARGNTARRIAELAKEIMPELDVDLRLTNMAGGNCGLETNADIEAAIDEIIADDTTKIIIMNAALCDFEGYIVQEVMEQDGKTIPVPEDFDVNDKFTWVESTHSGAEEPRLHSRTYYEMMLHPARKIISKIRQSRKDIFLVGFKMTSGDEDQQYIQALGLCKKSSCNLVVGNCPETRLNMIVTPEEARYHVTNDRDEVLRAMLEMAKLRSHLTFTRSTVVAGNPIPWKSEEVPETLRRVVNYCIDKNAYKPFNGATVGHFAYKVNDNTFLTSIRRSNFNDLSEIGLVKIVTDGPDTVLAYGAKPSVGGQSQRIIFKDHPGYDCVVHFHCPIKEESLVPQVSQREVECGSHACGIRTSNGLKQFDNLKAVYLINHGPNIIFNKNINPQEVIDFIESNFDLSLKTGGFVSIK